MKIVIHHDNGYISEYIGSPGEYRNWKSAVTPPVEPNEKPHRMEFKDPFEAPYVIYQVSKEILGVTNE